MKVAVIGHRKINKTQDFVNKLTEIIVNLIENEGADSFLFGSRSEFDDLCYDIITELRYKYPQIKRVYERAEYGKIDQDYLKTVLKYYEDTFYSYKVESSGKLAYVTRNEILVLACDVLLVYYDQEYNPPKKGNSGTKKAVNYAKKKNKRIINVF